MVLVPKVLRAYCWQIILRGTVKGIVCYLKVPANQE